MITTTDPIAQWTRQVAVLRAQAVKCAPAGRCGELTDTLLATCDSLIRELAGAQLECAKLRADVRASSDAWERLFEVMPGACLLTDSVGHILKANCSAGTALNTAASRLRDRELLVFSEDRAAFRAVLRDLVDSGEDELRRMLTFRPRERKPACWDVLITPMRGERSGLWAWFLTPHTTATAISRNPILAGTPERLGSMPPAATTP
jgi:hypothetical protein